jgi:hypothetical protein
MYRITITQVHATIGKLKIIVDGNEYQSNHIQLVDDHHEHHAEVYYYPD